MPQLQIDCGVVFSASGLSDVGVMYVGSGKKWIARRNPGFIQKEMASLTD